MDGVIMWARELAAGLLAVELPRRCDHVRGVAGRAENLRLVLGSEADLVVAACWLHDVGYAPDLVVTGFHPLDGARFLLDRGVDGRLCALVANHSGASLEASCRGVVGLDEFPGECSLARDAVWYCDMTTSPDGLPVTVDERFAEIRWRHRADEAVMRWLDVAGGEIRAAVGRVLDRVTAVSVSAG